LLFDHASLDVFAVGKADLLEVIFVNEATSVKEFVVVGSELGRVAPLDSVNKVVLPRVLLERVGHWLLQRWDEGRPYLFRTALARFDYVPDTDIHGGGGVLDFGGHLAAENLHSDGLAC
jgi:hypothetical protein